MTRRPPHENATDDVDSAHDRAAARPQGRVVAMKPWPIGTAARLAGIPPETLRIWERRYQLLAPGRTVGGHRLYSEDDVATLRAVKVLVDAGMRIGAVARMERARILDEAARMGPVAETPVVSHARALIDEIIEAAVQLDVTQVSALLDRPLMIGSGDEAVTSVYIPLLREVGERWHMGRLAIAVEHLIEKQVSSRIHAVLQQTPASATGRMALLACPPGERHEVGLFAAALVLRTHGFSTTVLGADLPARDLVDAVQRIAPSLVVLAVSNGLSDDARAALIPALNGALRDVPLVVGGHRAEELLGALTREASHAARIEDVGSIARRIAR